MEGASQQDDAILASDAAMLSRHLDHWAVGP